MSYQHNIENCFIHSALQTEFKTMMQEQIPVAINTLIKEANSGNRPLFDLTDSATNLAQINELAAHINDNFKHMVILGTGGSTLTGQALIGLKTIERKFNLPKTQIHFMDNVDPDTFNHLLNNINFKETCFITISKSGSTLETLSQFAVCLKQAIGHLGEENVSKHFWIISDPKDNPLRRIASKHNITALEHVEKIGGRFSIFTNVGLLPAAVTGMDIHKIQKGAQNVIDGLRDGSNLSPAQGAVINIVLEDAGINQNILMPYVDRLKPFTNWFKQIWAESLGKNGKGSTPIRGIGTLDQHSQQQLYLDGPKNKFFTFIIYDRTHQGEPFDNDILNDPALEYMHNRCLGDVITLSNESVIQTFTKHCLPVRTITIDRLDEEILGELAMHFIVETVLCGYIRGIDPYDQPAVEDAKILAKILLAEKDL